jgi:tetratricopeptide (TPR) repeat protein
LAKATKVPALFEQAAAHADVRAEAQMRWAYYELRLGHCDVALAHLDQAEPGSDTFVAYLQHVLRGRALEGLGRENDAVAEYRLAHEAAPHAQTAALALVGALVRENQPLEAAALVRDAVTTPLPDFNLADFDPWLMYGHGDERFWLPLIAQLHAAVVAPR